uniref:TSA: Wollemia nobilis Ref_Wollemi_Transcript_13819_1688 transcribed RNA sequence n=1 Tax=Wollemia nobilis TaxID=56998 RepID=A0A0C9S7D0_9CONI
MGASRKLQGEIDRVLKKVQEGVDVFDSIWNKVYDTENANQKEKFEADLKKEIKKLQRYRDQIKTWIQSSEIKDKKVSASYEQALLDARKLIEREMERFKVCEKETKTKAFSKEGLGQQPKTDPKEKAKSETRDWLNNMVSELESQIDVFEADIEAISVKKGKTRPPKLTHLEESISRHKAHISKLELILRLLDNDELSPEQVNDVKDFVEDYVERNQDDFEDFNDVDEFYNLLPLDKVEGLEDLVVIVPPSVVLKEKAVIAAAAGVPALNGTSLKVSLAGTTSQAVEITGCTCQDIHGPLSEGDVDEAK